MGSSNTEKRSSKRVLTSSPITSLAGLNPRINDPKRCEWCSTGEPQDRFTSSAADLKPSQLRVKHEEHFKSFKNRIISEKLSSTIRNSKVSLSSLNNYIRKENTKSLLLRCIFWRIFLFLFFLLNHLSKKEERHIGLWILPKFVE